jgi:agmatine deiminase
MTDRIFDENPDQTPRAIQQKIIELLELERLIIIPSEPGEMFGHADGVLQLLDDKTALVNDYQRIDPAFGQALGSSLRGHSIEIIPFPYVPKLSRNRIPSAEGVYINFLRTPSHIVYMTFNRPEDEQVLGVLQTLFRGKHLEPVQSKSLVGKGGGLHCITWSPVMLCETEPRD